MNQSEIFKLLLIVLLLANNDDNCGSGCGIGGGCGGGGGLFGINQILIIMLLLNPPAPNIIPDTDTDDDTVTF